MTPNNQRKNAQTSLRRIFSYNSIITSPHTQSASKIASSLVCIFHTYLHTIFSLAGRKSAHTLSCYLLRVIWPRFILLSLLGPVVVPLSILFSSFWIKKLLRHTHNQSTCPLGAGRWNPKMIMGGQSKRYNGHHYHHMRERRYSDGVSGVQLRTWGGSLRPSFN